MEIDSSIDTDMEAFRCKINRAGMSGGYMCVERGADFILRHCVGRYLGMCILI